MSHTIFGHVSSADGTAVAAGLAVDDGQIRLVTEHDELGTWPIDTVTIEQVDRRTIRLWIDEDSVDFAAEDQADAAQFVEARRLGTSSLWVAAAPGVWERAEARVVEPQPAPARRSLAVPAVAAAISLGVSLVGLGMMQSPADADPADVNTPTTAVVETNFVVPVDVPEVITPIGTPLIEIIDRWNGLALEYETGLEVTDLDRSSRWGRVSLELTTDQFGMFTEAHLLGDPLGDGQSDRRILVAMGQLVGAVDPTLDGPARRSLLAELGLDIGAPQIHLLDGSTTRNGVAYELWYDAATPQIHLRATPTG